MTNEPNSYVGISATANGAMLATIREVSESELWLLPSRDPAGAHRLDLNGRGVIARVEAVADGSFVVFSVSDDGRQIWRGRVGDGELVGLTDRGLRSLELAISFDGRTIVFGAYDRGVPPHLFAMDAEGRDVRQLTHGSGEIEGVLSPDGRWFAYMGFPMGVFRESLSDGAPPRSLSANGTFPIAISPDGGRIAYGVMAERDGTLQPAIEVAAADGGEALTYSLSRQGGSDLWRLPLDGTPATRLASFDGEVVFDFDWIDADRLLISRGTVSRDVVMIRDFQ